MFGHHACVEEQEIKPTIAHSLPLYLYDERKKTATHGEPVTPTLTQLPSLSYDRLPGALRVEASPQPYR